MAAKRGRQERLPRENVDEVLARSCLGAMSACGSKSNRSRQALPTAAFDPEGALEPAFRILVRPVGLSGGSPNFRLDSISVADLHGQVTTTIQLT